jgi:hypothetical protein
VCFFSVDSKELEDSMGYSHITVIDCPLLSAVPAQLKEVLPKFDAVVFADVCKTSNMPLSSHISQYDHLTPRPQFIRNNSERRVRFSCSEVSLF